MVSGVRDDLPSDITVQYGSFVFPSNLEIVGFQTRPVPDSAGRVYKALTHSVRIRFHLNSYDANNPDDSLDSSPTVNVPVIRAQLMRQADKLVLKNTAFGNYTVNGAAVAGTTASPDLLWGPRPQLLSQKGFYKYGSAIEWECSWSSDPCGGAVVNPVMAWNYGVSWNVDKSGYQTRAVKGSLQIPLTRLAQNNPVIPGNVDLWREKLTPPLPIGFQRDGASFDLSEDRTTLTFNIVDSQLPNNIPPPGVVIAEASHSAQSHDKSLLRFDHSIRASYELTYQRARKDAWNHFRALFQDRIDAARQQKQVIIPMQLSVSEPEIYGRKSAEFGLSYWQIGKGEGQPTDIINKSGLWRPAPESNWARWSDALAAANVTSPRGIAQLAWSPAEDALVSLCSLAPPLPATERSLIPEKLPGLRVAAPWKIERPDPEHSWLDYQLVLDVIPIDNTVVLQPLPTDAVEYNPPSPGTNATGGYLQPYMNAPCSIVQYRGAPTYVAYLWGRALRAGWDITPPQLIGIAGQTGMPQNDASCRWRTWVAANYGIPIIAAQWCFRYIIPCPPSSPFVAPSNPIYGGTALDQAETRELKGGVNKFGG